MLIVISLTVSKGTAKTTPISWLKNQLELEVAVAGCAQSAVNPFKGWTHMYELVPDVGR